MRNRFANMWKREEGVTLIELIAVLSLMSMILGIISTTIFFGFRSYNTVGVENRLREEGDILMSSIITELYVFAPDHVYPLANGKGFQMLHVTADGTEDPSDATTVSINETTGQLEIQKANVDYSRIPDPFQSTRINGRIVQGLSAITLEGNKAGGFDYYTTGSIKIKLALTLGEGTDSSQIELESRFGF